MGVGGFAVGLASTGFVKPFKSLGNQPGAWVWHSGGETLHNRKRIPSPLGEFGAGDTVGIWLAETGVVTLFLNGAEMAPHRGTPPATLPCGSYTLCCQPYMGGAATLVRAGKGRFPN
jgi:hypothetical protein